MDANRGFVQFIRSGQTEELLKDPKAFTLLSLIAYRAKRTKQASVYGLEIGEALIGDCKSCGLTEKEYRNSKKRLSRMGLATFKGTNRGTIAKLINSDVFDINPEERGEQKDEQRANKGRTRGEQRATNNKDKNEKNEKKDKKQTDDRLTHRKVDGLTVPKEPVKTPMPDTFKEVVGLTTKALPSCINEEERKAELQKQADALRVGCRERGLIPPPVIPHAGSKTLAS